MTTVRCHYCGRHLEGARDAELRAAIEGHFAAVCRRMVALDVLRGPAAAPGA